MPEARREHGLRAIERALQALQAQAAAGDGPRANAGSGRGEAIAEQRRRNREWKRSNPAGCASHDRAWFLREVLPLLDDVPLSAIARATGLSLASCSCYRTDARVPHPRHWETLLGLITRSGA